MSGPIPTDDDPSKSSMRSVSFMIDELTFLIGTAADNDDLLTADINELL